MILDRTVLNADVGEGFPSDGALIELIDWASVACGAHAGGRESAVAAIRAARARGVLVGAHPGFPDRAHFGRRPRPCDALTARDLIREQVETLIGWARAEGEIVRFLKPHGALYNQAQRDEAIASGVVEAALALRLPLLGLPDSVAARKAAERGVDYLAEGFPDRGYTPEGELMPRDRPGALLDDPEAIAAQAACLEARGLRVLCIHGDRPDAVALAARLRRRHASPAE